MRGKTFGIVIVVFAAAVAVMPLLYVAANMADGKLTFGASMLCLGPAWLIALAIAGAGFYMMRSGSQEQKEMGEVAKEQAILNMVETKGSVNIADIALELGLTRDQITAMVYDLVGKKLFTGYIDWKAGILTSKQAAEMPDGTCPNCGGTFEFAGKGTVKCPYCGTEVLLK